MTVKKLLITSVLFSAIFLSGCSTTPKGDPLGYVLGSAGGALIGRSVSDATWAPAAGAAGGLIAYAAYAELSRPKDQDLWEAYEQGKREARLEIAREFWINETDGDGVLYERLRAAENRGGNSSRLRHVQEPQFIEGVSYGGIYQHQSRSW